jgi:sugar/nucleoside kinase (ribokinase family)
LKRTLIATIGNPVYDIIKTRGIRTPERILSGCATNAAITLAKLGTKPLTVGNVGRDFVSHFDNVMAQNGVLTRMQESDLSAGFEVLHGEDGQRLLRVIGPAEPLTHLPEDLFGADVVIFGPILGEIPLEMIDAVKEQSSAQLILDPQGFVRRPFEDNVVKAWRHPEIESIVSKFDIVKPSEEEALTMTGLDARERPEEVLRMIHSWGCKIAIVTLAEKGSVIYDGEKTYTIPAYAVNAVNPTGAGDCYAAGFAFKMLQSTDIYETGCFASAVASIRVQHTGPDAPISLEESERRTRLLLKHGG